jgi:hypothetical protein
MKYVLSANVRNGSKPEKLNESKCFPLFTQQRTSPRYLGMSVSQLIGHSLSALRPKRAVGCQLQHARGALLDALNAESSRDERRA